MARLPHTRTVAAWIVAVVIALLILAADLAAVIVALLVMRALGWL